MDSLFGIGGPELILILIIAGVVMGPERIAHIARWLGKTTAQLQNISRAFMHQLTQELDGIDDDGALKDALGEMQALRKELETLKGELTATTTAVSKEGQDAIQEIKEASNSILPPSLTAAPTTNKTNGDTEKDTAVSINGNGNTTQPNPSPIKLPKPVDVEDDPE